MLRLRSVAAFHALALAAAAAAAQPDSGPLFPEPFRVEHHFVQEDGDGSRFVGEPVVDTYGGSWIVSQRPDESRLIIDLGRRELTEVRPAKGQYWTLSFDRFAELQARLRAAQVTRVAPEESAARKAARAEAAAQPLGELVVTEVSAGGLEGAKDARSEAAGALARPGVRRLRVGRKGEPEASALEVWVDPAVRLTPSAVEALGRLEAVLAGPSEESSAAAAPGSYLEAARKHAAGAFALRTRRPVAATSSAPALGRIEDVATRLEKLERFPSELVEIPEGLRRVPHPLEAMVRFLEQDAERNRALAGMGTKAPDGR